MVNELDDAWRVGAHTSSDRFRGSLRSGDTGDRALPDGGVRGVLVGAARQVKQPYAGTALYSLAEDKRATREQERELKRLTLALCRPDVNNIARIAAIQLAGQRGYAEILPAEIGLPSLLVVQKTTPADFRHPFPLALQKERTPEMKKYVCKICGYVYDPENNNGVAFEDLPDDWTCPMCGVGKDQFEEM